MTNTSLSMIEPMVGTYSGALIRIVKRVKPVVGGQALVNSAGALTVALGTAGVSGNRLLTDLYITPNSF